MRHYTCAAKKNLNGKGMACKGARGRSTNQFSLHCNFDSANSPSPLVGIVI